jgi:uncharacterized protein YjbI with pentapeptide repeats
MSSNATEEILRRGADAFNQWRSQIFDRVVDLSDCDLREFDFAQFNLDRVRFKGANLSGATFERASASVADFTGANLSGAVFQRIDVNNSDFTNAKCIGTKFKNTNLNQSNFTGADLQHAEFVGRFEGVTLIKADFRYATVSAGGSMSVDFTDADLRCASFRRAGLSDSVLLRAKIDGADFFETSLARTDFTEVEGATNALHLEAANVEPDAFYFERCKRSWLDRNCDWEALRRFGRMPLFGLSYTVLIFIPLYMYVIAEYNAQVSALRSWGDKVEARVAANPGDRGHHLAEVAKHHLHELPFPSLTFVLLVSTILLAIASTIYTFACPSRMKEFTKDVWCDQHRRSLIQYWPLCWKHRTLRRVCGACYVVGGSGALFVLVVKIIKIIPLVWQHTSFLW